VPDEPVPDDGAGLRAAYARLRAVVEAKDAELSALRAERDADREVIHRLGLRLAELERRLSMDSRDSGTIDWVSPPIPVIASPLADV
jgi:hypothetical protein